jgi:hypothetical protein
MLGSGAPTGGSVDAWRGDKYGHGGNKDTYVLNRSDDIHQNWMVCYQHPLTCAHTSQVPQDPSMTTTPCILAHNSITTTSSLTFCRP